MRHEVDKSGQGDTFARNEPPRLERGNSRSAGGFAGLLLANLDLSAFDREQGRKRRRSSCFLSFSPSLGDAAQSSHAKNSADYRAPRRPLRSSPSTPLGRGSRFSLIGASSRIGGCGERTGIAEFYKRPERDDDASPR